EPARPRRLEERRVAVAPAPAAADAVGPGLVDDRRGPLEHVAGQIVDPLRAVAARRAPHRAGAHARGEARPARLVGGLVVAPREDAPLGPAARGPLPLLVRGEPLVLRLAVSSGLLEVDAVDRVVALALVLVGGLLGALEVVRGAFAGLDAGGV